MKIAYPDGLPIVARRVDLLEAIGGSQVVIVAGETGSGKSTQLPKLCLELGLGVDKLIGHTQPRRVAARTIAERVAEELGTALGTTVGYTVRFTDQVSDTTMVKVMTDGILLSELQRDRTLSRYDTLIIDEAHERSLNVDFLLGYLKQLLPRRPDLKLIVTSATIDTARFSTYFGDAPVIEVSGRTYPVEIRYRPVGEDDRDDRDQPQAVCDAVDELASEGPGDVLVFLSGEREIHDTADALRALGRPDLEVLPLYARLSAAEQHRVFQAHSQRRVILATNVAETSLTVPGVRYVVDAGTARISRYSTRLKVQRLPIEPISQSSANQRAGRCGRVAAGVCIRLYAEDDFGQRPIYTEPEILRTSLASVILQMTAIGLGDVAAFPFLDPPDARAVRDGVTLLEELGALDPDQPADRRRLTKLGRQLAQLPVDPRLGRMVLEADRHNCVREVFVIASALSIQDPRERPVDKQQAADEMHARFRSGGSDFLALVALWDHLREQQRALSGSQFRKLCRNEFLNYLRVREWQDLYSQLRRVAGRVGVRPGTEAGHPDRVHQALLAGLLSQIGMRDGLSLEYRGARGSKFSIVRGSTVAKKLPKWVMAAEIVETNRLWARVAAPIQPEWAEQAASHLVKRSYGEPVWDARRGAAVTAERVTLFGLPIVAARTVGYDRVDRGVARQMFVDHALVAEEWSTHHAFVSRNRTVIDEARLLAARARRNDLVSDEAIAAFYERRLGPDITSARHFDHWWKGARRADPQLLDMMTEALLGDRLAHVDALDFPDEWRQDDLNLAVTYSYDPGKLGDGTIVHVPLPLLNQVRPSGFDWHVPGMRAELIGGMVRSLPKAYRKSLSPLTETIDAITPAVTHDSRPLSIVLAEVLSDHAAETIPADAFDLGQLAGHLRITFSVEEEDGTRIALGTDLGALRALLSGRLRAAIADTAPGVERVGSVRWEFGELPRVIETDHAGHIVRGYPALVDDATSVSVRVFTNPGIQARLMHTGTRRLVLLTTDVSTATIRRAMDRDAQLALGRTTRTMAELIDDCVTAVADAIVREHGVAWNADEFDTLHHLARAELTARAADAMAAVGRILSAATRLETQLARTIAPALAPSVRDARTQILRLVRPGFVTASGVGRLADIERYLRGVERRVATMGADIARDRLRAESLGRLERRYASAIARLSRDAMTSDVIEVGWLLEELRIGLFAQVVGTKGSVSERRVERELDRIEGLVAAR